MMGGKFKIFVNTFVDVTMYPQYNDKMIIKFFLKR
jgi:hypothetical protein